MTDLCAGTPKSDYANKPRFPELQSGQNTQGHAHWFLATLESPFERFMEDFVSGEGRDKGTVLPPIPTSTPRFESS